MLPIRLSHPVTALLLAVLFGLAGCKNQSSEPAHQAIVDIQAVVDKIGMDAQHSDPDEYYTVVTQLASLKERYNQQEYDAVLAEAPTVMAQARAFAAAKGTKQHDAQQQAQQQRAEQQELASDWATLQKNVPKSIATLETHVNDLAKKKPLPEGVTRGTLDLARGNLADAKSLWQQATDVAPGSLQDAVTVGRHAKEKADTAMADLGMTGTG